MVSLQLTNLKQHLQPKVLFENDGEIDPRTITTFGVSVKNNDSAIGFFGTGLKYAIAIILRNNYRIKIYSGMREYVFHTKKEEIRGRDFNLVYMNNTPLSFTTEHGKTWEMWMAVRELLSNCMDEGGEHYYTTANVFPEEGKTKIVVSGKDFETNYINREDFFLENKVPLYHTRRLQVFQGSTHNLFYKGIRIYKSNKPFLYTYNLLSDIDLTEDRTIKYSNYVKDYTLCEELLSLDNEAFITSLASCGTNFEEYYLGYSTGHPSSGLFSFINKSRDKVNTLIPPKLKLKCSPPLIDVLYESSEAILNPIQKIQLNQSIDFLISLGFNVSNYNIKVVENLGAGVLGLADSKRKIIYLSLNVFTLGTKYVAGTLYEEYLHIHHDVKDETRAFQDQVINHLMTVGELYLNRPL